ncbi:MAG: hypothetical protein IT444_05050 [Phycisphaeraceae bacterium]|nr:hypothetical protein [Phycisphaeraceae bacterium]
MKSCRSIIGSWLAGIVILVAVGVWCYRIFGGPSFDAAALKDTRGIEAVALDCQRVSRGYRVWCRVSNDRDQPVASVVLKASVFDDRGQVRAANPLVNVQNLGPGQQRELMVLVPTPTIVTGANAQIEVSLVSGLSGS